MRAVRSLLQLPEVFELVARHSVRRNARYLTELRAVRSLLQVFRGIRVAMSWSCKFEKIQRYSIELSCKEEYLISSNKVGSCKEIVRRNSEVFD